MFSTVAGGADHGGAALPVAGDRDRLLRRAEQVVLRDPGVSLDVELDLKAVAHPGGPEDELGRQLVVEADVLVEKREASRRCSALARPSMLYWPSRMIEQSGRPQEGAETDLGGQIVLRSDREARVSSGARRPSGDLGGDEGIGTHDAFGGGLDRAQVGVHAGERAAPKRQGAAPALYETPRLPSTRENRESAE